LNTQFRNNAPGVQQQNLMPEQQQYGNQAMNLQKGAAPGQ